MAGPTLDVSLISDSSVLVRFAGGPSVIQSSRIAELFHKLIPKAQELRICSFHPAYDSLLIDFDPSLIAPEELFRRLSSEIHSGTVQSDSSQRTLEIPVEYGGENGPDLQEVAELTKLSPAEVIALHASTEFTVAFLGFSPGFPYLLGLPEKLQVPRKTNPRLRAPAGSVAIAGGQAGIYSSVTSAGWQILGQTGVQLFDPLRTPASLLNPGDKIRFVQKAAATKELKTETPPDFSGVPVLRIQDGGFFSTLQDRGRFLAAHWGVSPGGAADPVALKVGNKLVGNPKEAAAIEMTVLGATVIFLKDTWVTVTGSPCEVLLDGQRLSMWTSVPVSAGQRLSCGAIREGLRSYLCVNAGLGAQAVLGSQSTLVSAGWGGLNGRRLLSKDILFSGTTKQTWPYYRKADATIRSLYETSVKKLRVTLGPQADWFTESAYQNLFVKWFEVSQDANRNGLRLMIAEGDELTWKEEFKEKELISEGIAWGSLQVTASGQTMILFCEQQTTGGYPKIATVIRADWYLLGQLKPGDRFKFEECSLEQAWKINAELEKTLENAVKEF